MRIFNLDAKEAAMCGNGIRCLVSFIRALGIERTSYRIETARSVHTCLVRGEKIAVCMDPVRVLHWALRLPLENEIVSMDVLDTGVPHAVLFVDDPDAVDLLSKGREIRNHLHFREEGVNVNFAASTKEGYVRMRTYERGVEGETLACGTGAVAVAVAAAEKGISSQQVRILPASGELLEVEITGAEIKLIGSAQLVFKGEVEI